MLTVLLKVLSILGIILLVLFCVLLAAVLLVLFLPVAYRVEANRQLAEQTETTMDAGDPDAEQKFLFKARFRANWLFGLLRVRFCYPDPGKLTVRLLWFKLFESSEHDKEKKEENKKKKRKKKGQKEKEQKAETADARTETDTKEDAQIQEATSDEQPTPRSVKDDSQPKPEKQKESIITKIKCTIQRICDKIKKIRDDIAFYRELLLCDDTRGLIDHAFRRLGKILKNIRPRRLRADIRFGTGSPDTTGYALGIYGMLSPHLGRHVNITPDFTQAVLEGELYAAGHITVFQLLWHGGVLVLDKRLRQLVKKLKERNTSDKEKG